MSTSKSPPSPSKVLEEHGSKEGDAHVMLGGSSGLMPGLADALNGWQERCETVLQSYPHLTDDEKKAYHKEFFETIWKLLGNHMANEYLHSLAAKEEDD